MELWLRFREATALCYDAKIDVATQDEWQKVIDSAKPISSILWPVEPLFRPVPPAQSPFFKRRHPNEKKYADNSELPDFYKEAVIDSYKEAIIAVAARINSLLKGQKILVYAPLRGAYPIWNAIRSRLDGIYYDTYYPVTSSFVFYSPEYNIRNQKGRIASGRFTHILELKRLRPFLPGYQALLYIDEIKSGGMMYGYLRDMINMGIHNDIPVYAAGIVDHYGALFSLKKEKIESMKRNNYIKEFIYENCAWLVTLDHKFLLGIHYVDYHGGLNIIPMLNEQLEYYPEKIQFEGDMV